MGSSPAKEGMSPTDTKDPRYFHKVVDCQWACPAHTNVPEYIRLIAQGRFTEAYLVNRASNVFPGILGRTCDRPCEPACRRGRVEEDAPAVDASSIAATKEPVAICRLKRVAADNKSNVTDRMPRAGAPNGKRIALIGGGLVVLIVLQNQDGIAKESTMQLKFLANKVLGMAHRKVKEDAPLVLPAPRP